MAILKIARMGHPILLRSADPVPDPTAPEIRRLVADMMETMEDAGGVGLAAPQVHVSLRLFVFRIPPGRAAGPADTPLGNSVLINPTVTPLDDDVQLDWEGCLSIPGLRAAVPRANRIRYTGVDTDNTAITREVEGFHARVVQHENDHLDGILYTMRMTDFRLFGFQEELARAQQAEDADLLFPGGVPDLLEAWCDLADRRMAEAALPLNLKNRRVTERIRALIALRLAQARTHRDATRHALGLLALPRHARVAARSTARTVDAIWHAAGDASADFSWYTKRGILASVYVATLLFWLRDTSEDDSATLAFLDRRLADVATIGSVRRRLNARLHRRSA